jgi:predicted Zn-dependent protease
MKSRYLDLAVLALVAIAVLLPRPDVKASPALRIAPDRLERVAELEAQLAAQPEDAAVALELADQYLDGHRPDWALAALAKALKRTPDDHRLHLRRSLALAEHFEGAPAHAAAARALALCESGSSVKCSDADRTRLTLLEETLRKVKDIDMREDPNTAKLRILRGLRPVYVPPRPKTAPPR